MSEISTKSIKELEHEADQKREALRKFRFGMSGGKVKNVKEGKNIKREIAVILTEISNRSKTNSGK